MVQNHKNKFKKLSSLYSIRAIGTRNHHGPLIYQTMHRRSRMFAKVSRLMRLYLTVILLCNLRQLEQFLT